MSEYKTIFGFKVKTLDTDTIVNTPSTGAWASGGYLNDGKPYGFGSGGVQTAAISFGGGLSNDTANENYNGTSWTENSAMSNGYSYATGCGSQTDAIAINGLTTPPFSVKNATEEWNGSSWTSGGNTNTARYNIGNQAFGTGSAAAFVGGRAPDYQPKAFHEQYNGSSWTETTDTPTDIFDGSAAGTQTNVILASGNHSKTPPGTSTSDGKTVVWDGSSWTEITEYSTARTSTVGTGVYNDFNLIGGYNPSSGNLALTENWDGSSWTELGDLSTARNSLGGGKTESNSTTAIAFGGAPNPVTSSGTVTEEFSVAPIAASIINTGQVYFNSTTNSFKVSEQTASNGSWASGGALPAAIRENAGAGATHTAALSFGGNTGSAIAETDSYNGTSWSEVAEMNTARRLLAGAGTQTSALAYGGWPPNRDETEEWNGSSWTEVADLNTARRQASGVGINAEACLMVGGNAEPGLANVESWNGSSWTEIADLNTAREGSNNWGTSTSAISAGGISAPGGTIASVEKWDGSSWTEITDLNVGRRRAGTSGLDNTSGILFGGDSPAPAYVATTEHFDGSSWTEVADLAEARALEASAGHSSIDGIAMGGTTTPGDVTTTEEWTATASNKTITTS